MPPPEGTTNRKFRSPVLAVRVIPDSGEWTVDAVAIAGRPSVPSTAAAAAQKRGPGPCRNSRA